MALFNKLFPGFKTTLQNSHEDNYISHKVSSFNAEQVRLVLFRECDFRGRKLLFDSDATEKIPIEKAEQDKKFVETSDGYGYLVISKPNSDYPQLSEMVFGSIAMSFRGTYFKIHSLAAPTRLMFTQVFPSPHGRRKNTSSTSSYQSQFSTQSSFEHSMKLDDSGASSNFSTSDRLSDRSTASDTVLVCRRLHSSPLDVPGISSSFSKNSLVVDSGCADQSYSSFSTGPLTFPTWESFFCHKGISSTSISSCGAFKRLLRTSTKSLQNSSISLPNSAEVLHKNRQRTSKLGLTIVVEFPSERELFYTQLFMEHITLLEALIWRTRQAIEAAYHRPPTFISVMMDIAQNTAKWLVNLLNAPRLVTNLWHCLFFDCDKYSSINAFSSVLDKKTLDARRTFRRRSSCSLNNSDKRSDKFDLSNSFSGLPFRSRTDIFNFNFSKFLKTDWDRSKKRHANEGELIVDKFLSEFCELLEELDVKDTNFFMSTLVTAVLTHHLGWVATIFPSSKVDEEVIRNFKQPYNALWDQLTDLYGAVGHPVKTAQTVVTGSNKNNVISKVLNSLTYFIRFGNIERKHIERPYVEEENKYAEAICMRSNSIPTEYYKKYEDHLKEIMTVDSPKPCCSKVALKVPEKDPTSAIFREEKILTGSSTGIKDLNRKEEPKIQIRINKGLSKIKTHTDLSELALREDFECSFEQPKSTGLSKVSSSLGEVLKATMAKTTSKNSDSVINENLLCSSSRGCDKNQNNSCLKVSNPIGRTLSKTNNFLDITILEAKTELEEQNNCDLNQNLVENNCDKSSVIFVLGDNEKLVGIKKEEADPLSSPKGMTDLIAGVRRKVSVAKRPSSLNLTKINYDFSSSTVEHQIAEPIDTYTNCNTCLMHSSSYESLCPVNIHTGELIESELGHRLELRAQSEPPEFGKITQPKYKYSRVKFNLQQYPQVVRNYMKSKNIELEGLSLGVKAFDKFATVQQNIKLDFSGYESETEETEALQTPSNASELEFTSDMCEEACREDSKEAVSLEGNSTVEHAAKRMTIINIPMPKTVVNKDPEYSVHYMSTVMKGLVDTYIPDMVLQGTTSAKKLWDSNLKNNLAINTQHSLLDQPVEESLAIVANTDTWEVQIMSSHTYVIDKGTNGVRVGMSQLVANMLESLLQMWKLNIPPQYCIWHIEQTLQELCMRSKALAQLLLASEFCSMELLTSSLRIEVNDVPLLMAVASTHTPEVTGKYGLSFH